MGSSASISGDRTSLFIGQVSRTPFISHTGWKPTEYTEEVSGETASVPSVDVGNLLYMHPTESDGSTLVSVPFDGLGYRSWRRSVLRALSVKNKLGFVTREVKMPQADAPQWERCDDMVTSWILNSLSKEISDNVEYVNDSAELWKELEDRYDQDNRARLYQVQRKINQMSQVVLDITGYYTRMKKFWEELNTLSAKVQCSCVCVCGANESLYRAEQDRCLIQFLMGLNEVYTVVRGSILMMNPLPSLAQIFAILIQEEKQREVKLRGPLTFESSTLNVNNNESVNSFRTNYGNNNNYSQGSSPRPYYDYCKKLGHVKEKCYKLIGYPPQDKYKGYNSYRGQQQSGGYTRQGNKGRGMVANMYGNCEETVPVKEQGVSLRKEQYHQLMGMMQQYQDHIANDEFRRPLQ